MEILQALQVLSNIKNDNNAGKIYYAANDKPASIMLQILIYAVSTDFPERGGKPAYGGINPTDNNGNYGGILKNINPQEQLILQYRWKVNYYRLI